MVILVILVIVPTNWVRCNGYP